MKERLAFRKADHAETIRRGRIEVALFLHDEHADRKIMNCREIISAVRDRIGDKRTKKHRKMRKEREKERDRKTHA